MIVWSMVTVACGEDPVAAGGDPPSTGTTEYDALATTGCG